MHWHYKALFFAMAALVVLAFTGILDDLLARLP